jgi:hypothetical protein
VPFYRSYSFHTLALGPSELPQNLKELGVPMVKKLLASRKLLAAAAATGRESLAETLSQKFGPEAEAR